MAYEYVTQVIMYRTVIKVILCNEVIYSLRAILKYAKVLTNVMYFGIFIIATSLCLCRTVQIIFCKICLAEVLRLVR